MLIAAGSDSGGGAGIQADIKTVTALGGFAMTAITALIADPPEGLEAGRADGGGWVVGALVQRVERLGRARLPEGVDGEAAGP